MSAEGTAGALAIGMANGAGVALATQIPLDLGLLIGAATGCCGFLAASVKIPWGSRIFYGLFSFGAGYIAGWIALNFLEYNGLAAGVALIVASLASFMLGSLKDWSEGGPKPEWLDWGRDLLSGMVPSFLKRGKREDG
ncbi:hypothetical protein IRZ53_17570 [Pseudomonas fulva]|uniref:hypothetical protein n=1 Tax=Pseudomonas fulva TaxID=47880 RepID=UPI00067264C1|nr:hypothetical protein [Pseudomonas fulva]MBF8676205.1 hypothetical protein [Pseudomonas fulva]MBF8698593.1 hypothetical protein [Pseudomonas fulva]WHU44548.1 hypothetical protein OXL99_12105 [Pseudomonas fulva]